MVNSLRALIGVRKRCPFCYKQLYYIFHVNDRKYKFIEIDSISTYLYCSKIDMTINKNGCIESASIPADDFSPSKIVKRCKTCRFSIECRPKEGDNNWHSFALCDVNYVSTLDTNVIFTFSEKNSNQLFEFDRISKEPISKIDLSNFSKRSIKSVFRKTFNI